MTRTNHLTNTTTHAHEQGVHLIFDANHGHHTPTLTDQRRRRSLSSCRDSEEKQHHHDRNSSHASLTVRTTTTTKTNEEEEEEKNTPENCLREPLRRRRHSGESHSSQDSIPMHHHHSSHVEQHLHGSIFASVVLLVALCLHSVIAGISLGIENSMDAITSIAIAILMHKFFAGFALGSTMIAAEVPRSRHIKLSLVFASSTPIGIALGLLARNYFTINSTVKGFAQATVGGTFLYISVVEIAIKELLICRDDPAKIFDRSDRSSVKKEETCKLFALVFGYSAMSVLAIWV